MVKYRLFYDIGDFITYIDWEEREKKREGLELWRRWQGSVHVCVLGGGKVSVNPQPTHGDTDFCPERLIGLLKVGGKQQLEWRGGCGVCVQKGTCGCTHALHPALVS